MIYIFLPNTNSNNDGKSYRDGVDITSNDIYAIQDEKVIKNFFTSWKRFV